MNISTRTNDQTARTSNPCAKQRAENLFSLGVKSVLEMCVGPSLKTLEHEYNQVGITVTGNDIEERWKNYYPQGKWLIGDARTLSVDNFDAVVVAPPLSKGCSGARQDSLSIDEVFPSYYDFLGLNTKHLVLVLPGRTLSLKEDRKQLHKLISTIKSTVEVVPLVDRVTKYVDLYITK